MAVRCSTHTLTHTHSGGGQMHTGGDTPADAEPRHCAVSNHMTGTYGRHTAVTHGTLGARSTCAVFAANRRCTAQLMVLPAHQALTAPTARTVQTARTAHSALTAPTLQTARTVLIACASWAACDSRCCCLRCARVRTPRAGGTFPMPGAAARRMTGQRRRIPRRCPC